MTNTAMEEAWTSDASCYLTPQVAYAKNGKSANVALFWNLSTSVMDIVVASVIEREELATVVSHREELTYCRR